MKFVQSRYQDYFSRCYEALCCFIYIIIFSLVGNYIFSFNINLIDDAAILLVFTLGTIGYIQFKYKNGSQFLQIDESKIIYGNKGVVAEINNKDFQGYKISKFLPYQVVIKNKIYGKTAFSYYAFSLNQRKKIFELLEEYSANKQINQDK